MSYALAKRGEMRKTCLVLIAFLSCAAARSAVQRSVSLDDLNHFQDVSDPQVAPDGRWVLYTVSSADPAADRRQTDIWMVSWDGSQTVQLTYTSDSESSSQWSPDGKYISFLSSRPGKAKGAQVWVMDRRGGEARQLTEVKSPISAYQWSPDSKRLALVMTERDEPETDAARPGSTPAPPKPIVIDRYRFKQDVIGYVTAKARSRIYLYDIASGKAEPLTGGAEYEEQLPAWSPDGTTIAFVSNRDANWERTANTDVWVADAQPGSALRKLTVHPGADGGRLAWSPDGSLVAYTQGSDPRYNFHSTPRLAVASAAGGAARLLAETLDRGVSSPRFSEDGRSLEFLVADDRYVYLETVPLAGGTVERLTGKEHVLQSYARAAGHTAVLATSDNAPPEIFALEGGAMRKLTSHNDALMAELRLGPTEDITFKSKDGTEVHGIVVKPPSYEPGKKYPTLVHIHGGPTAQDTRGFQYERQFFAANGYVVLAVNYRGSSGRGAAYSESIFADWGNREVADVLAGVDFLVAAGVADPARLGIGGWSYGGLLTDYVIASDTRFKAAISGAGSANHISLYGHDQYVYLYDSEFGPPWQNLDLWLRFSYPFFKADRIRTPTLFLGGEKDFNVPILGGEQMYQALKNLGVPTELVVYPNQFHGLTRLSFIRDRYERYLAWYDKYLKSND